MKTRKLIALAIAGVTLTLTADAGPPNSLWARRRSSRLFLVGDTQARRVGDLITVLINEDTAINNSDQRNLNKNGSNGFNMNVAGSASGDLGSKAGAADVTGSSNSQRAFNGTSQFTSARGFMDRVTVTVTAVLPNGNLVISGQRTIRVEDDSRILKISGVVRPIDVTSVNTVESRYVADFDVNLAARGTGRKFSNQGWFSRGVNRFWPF